MAFHSSTVMRRWQSGGTRATSDHLMYPIFISDDVNAYDEIDGMPGQYRFGVNGVVDGIRALYEKGLRSVLLIGAPVKMEKNCRGWGADDKDSPVIESVRLLRREFRDLLVACDVCLCPYTDHGHCGIPTRSGCSRGEDDRIDIDASNSRVADVALAYAKAGCQLLAVSDVHDDRVKTIRRKLRENRLEDVAVMACSATFESALYGPFTDALYDRKCAQLPVGARGEAKKAVDRDVGEGADMVMVKPGMPCLDIVGDIRARHQNIPIAIYQVSGEHAMLYQADRTRAFRLRDAVLETWEGFRRAGADLIISYFVPQALLEWGI